MFFFIVNLYIRVLDYGRIIVMDVRNEGVVCSCFVDGLKYD